MTTTPGDRALKRKRARQQRGRQTLLSACAAAALTLLCLALATPPASAQTSTSSSSHIELAATYAANHANTTSADGFWMQGGSAEIAGYTRYHLGLVASVSGYHAGATPSRNPVSLVIPVFGPRFVWSFHAGARRPLAIFGHSLLGEAHGFRGAYPASGGTTPSASSFAIQTGGGMDIGISRHLAWRVVEADWLRTSLPNSSTGAQNNLRLTAGVVLRLQPPK
jgi:hypothetical protein